MLGVVLTLTLPAICWGQRQQIHVPNPEHRPLMAGIRGHASNLKQRTGPFRLGLRTSYHKLEKRVFPKGTFRRGFFIKAPKKMIGAVVERFPTFCAAAAGTACATVLLEPYVPIHVGLILWTAGLSAIDAYQRYRELRALPPGVSAGRKREKMGEMAFAPAFTAFTSWLGLQMKQLSLSLNQPYSSYVMGASGSVTSTDSPLLVTKFYNQVRKQGLKGLFGPKKPRQNLTQTDPQPPPPTPMSSLPKIPE
jgi:hypothetical protein